MQIKKLAVAAAAVGALGLSLLTASPASADYAPSNADVINVGSDTVQFAIDFLSDGDYNVTGGYNATKRNKLITFDATPDANARLAYGSYGLNGTSAATSNCAPGTGGTAGTGNQNVTHTGDRPCVLNPTIVLRAQTRPVQRPNGSGAGFNALKQDVTNGTSIINFIRSSSARCNNSSGTNVNCTGVASDISSIVIGTDNLAMLTRGDGGAPAANGSNAVALSTGQLGSIYTGTVTRWSQVGGTSNDIISPLIPQVGSGTRSSFLSNIGINEAAAVAGPAVNAEENDPEAIEGAIARTETITITQVVDANHFCMAELVVGKGGINPNGVDVIAPTLSNGGTATTSVTGATADANCTTAGQAYVTTSAAISGTPTTVTATYNGPTNGIEPMSSGRLNMYKGLNSAGTSIGLGYFGDPSCAYGVTAPVVCTAAGGTATIAGISTTATKTLNPNVFYWTTGSPSTGTLYNAARNMYLYFRNSDVNSTAAFQSGGARNWVRELLYNPCGGTNLAGQTIAAGTGVTATNCTGAGGNSYGPGGAPFIETSTGRTLISSSGIVPSTTVGLGFQNPGA